MITTRMHPGQVILGVLTALVVVVLGGPAYAAQDRWSFLGDTSRSLGANMYQDTVAFCTKDTQLGPVGSGKPTHTFTDIAVITAGEAFVPGATNQSRSADIPATRTGQLAYLVYRGTQLAASGDQDGAMAAHHAMTSLTSGGAIAEPPSQAVAQLSQELSAEAARLAGPYTLSAVISGDTLADVGVRSASGQWVPGFRIEFAIQGPARTPAAVTSGSEPIAVPLEFTGFGSVTVTASAAELPPISTRVLQDPVVQDLFAVGSPSSATVTTTTTHTFELSTSARDAQLAVGDELVDLVTVSSAQWPGSAELEVTVTAYGPFEVPQVEQDEVPADAPVAGTGTFSISTPGQYESPVLGVVERPGFYTYVATAAGQTGRFFEGAETAIAPWSATVVTRAFERDGQLWDAIEVSGLPDTAFDGLGQWDAVNEITHALYYFADSAALTSGATAELEPIRTWTTPAANGTSEVGGFPLDDAAPGTYVFVASFPGDSRVQAFRTSETDTAEQWVVEEAEVTPEPSTTPAPEPEPTQPSSRLPETGAAIGWGLLAGSGVLGGASALVSRRHLER